jgi:putative sigma-54 modulation protein
MQIEIAGQNIEVTQALRAYVTEKLDRLQRHFDNLIGARVVLRLERVEHYAEATVSVGGRTNDIHADATAEDMYAAIDKLVDKLDRQVRRHKEKVKAHNRSDRPAQAG